MNTHSRNRGASGFSLIEVMIAVIVLATGLLALAALQAKLTANSADAKARSRIAALMTSAIDDERASGYTGIAAFGATSCTTTTPTALQTAICTAESDAGVSGLQVSQTVSTLYGLPTAGSFTTTVPAASVKIYGEYKRVQITATWTDATGGSRTLGMTTVSDQLGLATSSTLLIQPLVTSNTKSPIVHEANPSLTAGVIPIAVGANTDSAATNPRPTLGLDLPSTTFNTLTYTQGSLDTSATSTIQKRVETAVAECVCGAATSALTNDIFLGTTTFRPTYWNGTKYIAPSVPSPAVSPVYGPYSGVTQNDLCTQCCRDHHDTSTDTVKFDPVTGNYNRYKARIVTTGNGNNAVTTVTLDTSSGAPVIAGATDPYLDACRVIRVDGLWRVAADMQSDHMGLIATTPKGFATSASPDTSSAASYEDFVIDYLGQKLTSIINGSTTPVAATVFASHNLNDPTSIDATTISTAFQYLHARGLYLDHLEQAALDKLTSVNATCAAANFPQCLLPYLPFNTINVTELANWSSSATSILTVTNGSTACTTGAPIRGCVNGKALGAANANVKMGTSNSAVASSLAISPYELAAANVQSDAQAFQVTGTSTASEFFASLAGLSQTSDLSTNNDPSVLWGVGINSGDCFTSISRTDTNPNPYDCVTTVPLTLPVNVTVGSYNQVTSQTIANPCSGGSGTVSRPVLTCSTVTAASLTGGYNTAFTVSGTKTTAEQTQITITKVSATTLTAGLTLNVTFGPNGSAAGTYTCDAVTFIPTFTTPSTCP